MNDSDVVGLVVGCLTLGVIGIVALARRWGNKAYKYNLFGKAWQEALRAVDSQVRIVASGNSFSADLQYDNLPFLVEFGDHVRIAARVPSGITVALPPGGRLPGIAQRVDYVDGTLSLVVGLEKHTMLLAACQGLAPVVRQAIADSARVGVGPLH